MFITASAGPAISVVRPLTISWWAWWLVARSKGDLRSLMAMMNISPSRKPGMLTTAGMGWLTMSATWNEPVAR